LQTEQLRELEKSQVLNCYMRQIVVSKVSKRRELKKEAHLKRQRKKKLVTQSVVLGSVLWLFCWLLDYALFSRSFLFFVASATLGALIYPSIYLLAKRINENSALHTSGAAPLVDGGGVNALYVQGNWLDRWEREKSKERQNNTH
jgi:hypothetical protein